MKSSNLKDTFAQAPRHLKVLLVSGFLLAISVFLPWYQDVDAFHSGDQFLGITGPTSYMGVSILVMSAASLLLSVYRTLGRRLVKLPWQESSFQLFVACEAFFLLAITNSIYVDTRFGVNITMKETLFGMTLALLSSVGLGAGAYLMKKSESTSGMHNEQGDLKPLIAFNDRAHASMSQSQSSSSSAQKSHEDSSASVSPVVETEREVESQQMGF